ncbi:MAG: hypothetical protein C0602_12415 [Denitrovibrio sp.]|nr:MAG: hypothetical protein C0602_12415 [Denitrovibrio sp.]
MNNFQNIEIVRKLKLSYQRSAVVFTSLVLIVFSVFMTYISYNANISTYKSESLKVINNFIDQELHFDINEIFDNPEKHKNLTDRIDLFMKMSNLIDFRIWNSDFRTVYSYSDKLSVGKYFRDNDDLRHVYETGEVEVNIEEPEDAETEELKSYGTLFEMYSPILLNGDIVGVLEVYRLWPPLNFFDKDNLMICVLSMLVPLLLYLLINKHFNKAAETIIGYHKHLQASFDKTTVSYIDTIISLTKALEMRDMETEGHSERVVNMAFFIGKKLGLKNEEQGKLTIGSYLHDIGKIGVPDSILLKPAKLDPEERLIIEKHVTFGYNIIKDVKFLSLAKEVILYHHEKWDGTGYPEGLKGEDIPLNARIFAIVDVFDALVSERPYKSAFSIEKALEIIKEGRGTHFDPQVADVILNMTEEEVRDINKNLNKDQVISIVYNSVVGLLETA